MEAGGTPASTPVEVTIEVVNTLDMIAKEDV